MNDEALNLGIRKFLKEFGITAQREIERAVQAAVRGGTLPADGVIRARARLDLPELNTHFDLERQITVQ